MSDLLELVTAILGMVASIIALRGIVREKAGKVVVNNKSDHFKELKSALNVVGSIALILCLYFGFMILMIGFPKILSFVAFNESTTQVESIDTTKLNQLDEYNSNNELAYIAALSFNSTTDKDNYLEKILDMALEENDFDLVLDTISSLSSNNKKDLVASSTVKILCNKNEYKYAIKVALLHNNNNTKDEDLKYIIEQLNNNKGTTSK